MKKNFFKILITIILSVMVLIAASGCSSESDNITSIEDLKGCKAGAITGSVMDIYTTETIPDAEIVYYENITDIVTALENNKIDTYCINDCTQYYMEREKDNITHIDDVIISEEVVVLFNKADDGKKLCNEFNSFLAQYEDEGKLQNLKDKWVLSTEGEQEKAPDLSKLSNRNGTLDLMTDAVSPPMSYLINGGYNGYEIELIYDFCKANGYGLNIIVGNYSSYSTALASGEADMAASFVSYTEERAEEMSLSDSTYDSDVIFAVNKNSTDSGTGFSFFNDLKKSFVNTFITEDRYKEFLGGLWVTTVICLLSVFFGTLLGVICYIPCNKQGKVSRTISGVILWLLDAIPVVVFLMILFYVVFNPFGFSAETVSVIGFSIIFGGSVFGMLQTGINTIDKGQMEGAIAMGYTRLQAYIHIILPQAIRLMLPVYSDSISTLIKETAIVGYIAVQDLTKIADIIRARTFEAFLPLITVGVLYFILAEILIHIIKLIEKKTMPQHRTPEKILKGIVRENNK